MTITVTDDGNYGRGGNGRNGDGTWPPTDGRGCPTCGAYSSGGAAGGHGGGCPNQTYTYDENGRVTGRLPLSGRFRRPPQPFRMLED